jgi:hypothetical protein
MSYNPNVRQLDGITGNVQNQLNSLNSSVISISSQLTNLDSIYATDSMVASISANLNNKIDSINLIAGSNITIVEGPTNTWTISASNISGGSGSTSGVSYNGIQGRLQCNNTEQVYTISHPEIDSDQYFPVVSLDVPTSGSDIFVQGVYDRNDTSFKVVLSGLPTSGYGILWHIVSPVSGTTTSGSGGFIPLEGYGIEISPSGSNYSFSINSTIKEELNNGLNVTFTYSSGLLATKTTTKGTQTFNYDVNDNLVAISGSGEYKNKQFIYDINGDLTAINIIV